MAQTTGMKTPLTLSSLTSDYAVYNAWANKRLVRWLQSKPSGLMELDVPSSFPGLRGTLVHIWDTQRLCLALLQQTKAPASFRQGFYGSMADVFTGLMEHSTAFATYVQSLSEAELQTEINLTTPWFDGMQPRVSLIHHCTNHGTYHRGQLIMIGRTIGLTDAPTTDYSFYREIG